MAMSTAGQRRKNRKKGILAKMRLKSANRHKRRAHGGRKRVSELTPPKRRRLSAAAKEVIEKVVEGQRLERVLQEAERRHPGGTNAPWVKKQVAVPPPATYTYEDSVRDQVQSYQEENARRKKLGWPLVSPDDP